MLFLVVTLESHWYWRINVLIYFSKAGFSPKLRWSFASHMNWAKKTSLATRGSLILAWVDGGPVGVNVSDCKTVASTSVFLHAFACAPLGESFRAQTRHWLAFWFCRKLSRIRIRWIVVGNGDRSLLKRKMLVSFASNRQAWPRGRLTPRGLVRCLEHRAPPWKVVLFRRRRLGTSINWHWTRALYQISWRLK